MPTPLYKLAELVGGYVVGNEITPIHSAKPLNECEVGDISFIEEPRFIDQLRADRVAAVVCDCSVMIDGIPLIRVDDPLNAFVTIVRHFRGTVHVQEAGINPQACVHLSAVIGQETSVGPLSFVGAQSKIGTRCIIHNNVSIGPNCVLGDDVILYPGVVLYEGTKLGNRVIIHSNSVIGADGFGYRTKDGKHDKVPQLGNVDIGDDVEIGACTAVDRGTFMPTRIGQGTKIDNLVQIAHNCQIGDHNLLISQMGIAGSSSTGEYVVVAGQVGVADHVHIGAGSVIGAKAGVTKDVAPQSRMLGAPATPERQQKKILMSLEKLPDIRRELKRIKQQIGFVEESAA